MYYQRLFQYLLKILLKMVSKKGKVKNKILGHHNRNILQIFFHNVNQLQRIFIMG